MGPHHVTAGIEYLCGSFRINPARQQILCDGAPVQLGGRAFDLLRALVERAGELVTKQELFAAAWPGLVVEENNLAVTMSALRRALGCGIDGQRYVATVAGRGYRFVAPVTRVPMAVPASPILSPETGNLPSVPAPLIGRDDELATALTLLGQSRLLSLIGPGGVGKTRLALALGAAARDDFPDGVWLVELAALTLPELVAEAIAAVFGLAVSDRHSATALIATYLRQRKALLILDNCEHLLDPVAHAATAILAACPHVTILATSREAIRIVGEQSYAVPSLAEQGAVRLFLERAAAAIDGFRPAEADLPVVVEICRRLDGVALAIELAVPRLRMLSLAELLARLDDRFQLLTGGNRLVLPRHQTLRALIDWSYDLLDSAERTLLERLAIFAGGFALDGAAAVYGGAEHAVFDLLASLVDKSLVIAEIGQGPARYRLLETTRAYAAERLNAAGDTETARRHAAYIGALLIAAESDYETKPSAAWLATYAPELDNVRASLGWAFGPGGDPAAGVALTAYGRQLWFELGLNAELRRWLDLASRHIDAGAEIPPAVMARLLLARSHRAVHGVRSVAADYRQAMALAEAAGEPALAARARAMLALNDFRPEGARRALDTVAAAIEVMRPLGLARSVAVMTGRLGLAADLAGEKGLARHYFEEAIRLATALGNSRALLTLRSNLAELLFTQGEIDDAIAQARSSIALARQCGLRVNECQTGTNLGAYLMLRGDTDAAAAQLRASLVLARSLGEDFLAMNAVQHLALALVRHGEPQGAARLLGWTEAAYAADMSNRESTEQATYDRLLVELAASLPEQMLTLLRAEGAGLTLDRAAQLVG